MVNGRLQATSTGVPQGGPLSPLLANILLDDLDKELEKRGHRFVRYADDFIIMVKSLSAGHRVMDSIRRFLERKLRLKVNEKKSKVGLVEECGFLGFVFLCVARSDGATRLFGSLSDVFVSLQAGVGSRFHGVPSFQTCGVCSGLDELLRNVGVLSSDSVIRRMAPSQDTDVLLETVAVRPYQSASPPQAGNIEKARHTDRVKQEGALVPRQNLGNPGRHDQ